MKKKILSMVLIALFFMTAIGIEANASTNIQPNNKTIKCYRMTSDPGDPDVFD